VKDDRAWRAWWENPLARQYYFIGKDNIFFHTSLWPAELMGVGTEFASIFVGMIGWTPYDCQPTNS
jgi:methionyl-tRNA synthetase